MMNVVDGSGGLSQVVPADVALSIVASLGADPMTIGELERALGRFMSAEEATGFFASWQPGVHEQPPTTLAAIGLDLPGRLLVHQELVAVPETSGHVYWREQRATTAMRLFYGLPGEWLFLPKWRGWRSLAESRRRDLRWEVPRASRQVLYHELAAHIVDQCRGSRVGEDPIVEIHAEWLLGMRRDLNGQSPRSVLLKRQAAIDLDLQYQEYHWARRGESPPGLDRDSWAFQFGGYGSHELVMYHGLVRHLVKLSWDRHQAGVAGDVASEVDYLQREQQDWLHSSQEDLADHTPAQVIARERARLPLVASGEHLMLDHDCPLCRLAAEQPGPVFWHLHQPDMDAHFAFSTCETLSEWEAFRRELKDAFDSAAQGGEGDEETGD